MTNTNPKLGKKILWELNCCVLNLKHFFARFQPGFHWWHKHKLHRFSYAYVYAYVTSGNQASNLSNWNLQQLYLFKYFMYSLVIQVEWYIQNIYIFHVWEAGLLIKQFVQATNKRWRYHNIIHFNSLQIFAH